MATAYFFRFLERPFDAKQFTAVRFGIPFFLVMEVARADPAVGAADDRAIVEDGCRAVEVVHIIFGIHAVQFSGTGPPVVVVAADNDFFARKGADLIEVLLGFVEAHGPRRITGNEDCIVIGDSFFPVFGNALPVVFPAGAEDFHRLFWRIAR